MLANVSSKHRTRARTATVAFPFVAPLGNTLEDSATNACHSFTPFSKNNPTVGSYGSSTFTKLNNSEMSTFFEEHGIPNLKMPDSNLASNVNFHLPQPRRQPPPLNPKLRILKTAKALRKSVIEKGDWNSRFVKQIEDFPIPTTAKFQTNHSKDKDMEKNLPFAKPIPIKLDKNITKSNGAENENNNRQDDAEFKRLSESLYLDQAGLNQFPNLGPNDRQIKLLSLQHNFISRLQNLVLLKHLIVLDLYNNKIERITGLEAVYSLRVLLLGKNRIRRIEGFDAVPRLEILDLHGNQLRYLDNLNSLNSLRIFNVAGNNIRSIRNFEPSSLLSLTELNLKRNRIKSLIGLEKMSHLRKLLLSNNELQSILSLHPLGNLSCLEELVIDGNPLCSIPKYKSQVLLLLPSLTILNRVLVTETMRIEAQLLEPRHIAQEQDLKRKEEKYRLPVTTSREDVIHEARRRWESVKLYVKNNQDEVITKSHNVNSSERRAKSEPRQITQNLNEELLYKHLSYNFVNIPKLNSDMNVTNIQNDSKYHFETLRLQMKQESTNYVFGDNHILNVNSNFEGSNSSKLTKVAIVRPLLRNCLPNQNTTSVTLQNDADVRITPYNQQQREEDTRRHLKASYRELEVEVENVYEKQDTLISIEKKMNSTIIETLPESSITTTLIDEIKKRSNEMIIHKYLEAKIEESNKTPMLTNQSVYEFPEIGARVNNLTNLNSTMNSNFNFRLRMQQREPDNVETSDSETTSTNTSTAPTTGRPRRASASILTKHVFHHRKSKKRGQTAKYNSCTSVSPKSSTVRRPLTGVKDSTPIFIKKTLKRVNSFSKINSTTSESVKKQGIDYLVEINGKILSLFGQGALKHFLTGFSEILIETINCIKFYFITYDSIIPYFGKLRQTYPAVEHFQFRANNISMLSQLNAMTDLQGLTSLQICEDGNPIIQIPFWEEYALYRLGHWGLKQINGKEVTSEYNGGNIKDKSSQIFASLGYLAISSLPEASLTPLAKKLHTLQNFCSCSQSSSSDDSGRKKGIEIGDGGSSERICSSWDDDPVLLDVIGKEALVYISQKQNENLRIASEEIITRAITEGSDMLKKLEKLNQSWPELLETTIDNILQDYASMDDYMEKELKKLKKLILFANKK